MPFDYKQPISSKVLKLKRLLGDEAPYEAVNPDDPNSLYALDVANTNKALVPGILKAEELTQNPTEAYGVLAPQMKNTKDPLMNTLRSFAGTDIDPEIQELPKGMGDSLRARAELSDEPLVPTASTQAKPSLNRTPMAEPLMPQESASLSNPYNSLERLKAAQKAESDIETVVNMARIGQNLGDVIGRTKTDKSFLDEISKQSQSFVRNYEQQEKARKSDFDINNEQTLQDPNSPVSKASRDLMAKMGMPVSPGTSAAQLKASGVNLGSLLAAKESSESRKAVARMMASERQDNRDLRKKQNQITNFARYQESFNKDKAVQKATEALDAARDASALLEMNSPISDEVIKRKLARLSGEVGVLTDKDVSVFGGSKAVVDRIEQATQQMVSGTLTDTNRKFMREILAKMQVAQEKNIKIRAKHYADQGSKRFDLDPQEAFDYILPGQEYPQESTRSPKSQVNPVQQPNASADEEIRMTKDGKLAVFNRNTKQFIRYAQ